MKEDTIALLDSLREVRCGQKRPQLLKAVTMVTSSMKLMRRDTRGRAACSHSWTQLLLSQMHSSVLVSYVGYQFFLN